MTFKVLSFDAFWETERPEDYPQRAKVDLPLNEILNKLIEWTGHQIAVDKPLGFICLGLKLEIKVLFLHPKISFKGAILITT